MLKEEELQELGQELRGMRREMHMTQEKMAEALDVDPRMISRYENGNAEMGVLLYRKVLRLYEKWKSPQSDGLLQRIKQLTPEQRGALELLFCNSK